MWSLNLLVVMDSSVKLLIVPMTVLVNIVSTIGILKTELKN